MLSKFEIVSCQFGVLNDGGIDFKIINDCKDIRKVNTERGNYDFGT